VPNPTPLTTKDGRFGYEAAGSADLPPLVFLHGIGGAARGWRNQLEFFGDRYRAIAWDMPGYGGSAPLPDVSIPSLAAALADFLRATGAVRPVIVGHSIGGMIVQQLLVNEPRIASAVVLAQTSPAFGRPEGDWQKQFIEARLGPLDRGASMASLAPTLVADLVGNDPDPEGTELARSCMAAVREESYRASMMSMLGFNLRGALKQISVPALLLSGSRDKNAPAPMMAKMATYVPGATYVELEGVGHLVNLERPGEFNAVLSDFLSMSHEISGGES
jgi:3-oxoadipate enol-lactonase